MSMMRCARCEDAGQALAEGGYYCMGLLVACTVHAHALSHGRLLAAAVCACATSTYAPLDA